MPASRDDLASISGPASMAKPPVESVTASSTGNANGGAGPPAKKKRHRAGKKRKNRRTSFAAPSETTESVVDRDDRPSLLDSRPSAQQSSFYRLQGGNRSNTSLESEALLDHREHSAIRVRRTSQQTSGFGRPSLPFQRHRNSQASGHNPPIHRARYGHAAEGAIVEDGDGEDPTDRTPLLGMTKANKSKPELSRNNSAVNYSSHGGRARRGSGHSKASSRRRIDLHSRGNTEDSDFDVNNPPSVPNSPKLGSMDDVMIADLNGGSDRGRDAIITIDDPIEDQALTGSPDEFRRRATVADMAERDVCFPGDVSEIGDEDERGSPKGSARHKRRRTRRWPDFDALEDWAREEKEERSHQEQIRVKKIKEPAMVGGRLRAQKTFWHREEEDAPFRFTYFNEALDGTIHARTISDLLQDGLTFRDLFLPDPLAVDSESEDDDDENALERHHHNLDETTPERNTVRSPSASKSGTGSNTPLYRSEAPTPVPKPQRSELEQHRRHGARPTFWLDVLNPTDMEMKVISKAFGIHQLTTEDILVSEQREKVELFSNYYFVNYRSFEQDKDSEDYMEPVNMYVVVFRDGVITFHHTMTPHPANVRRRIRQLNDYMSPTADWISYAIIDDVTDVYAPLVADIEQEVDDIDDDILYMQSDAMGNNKNKSSSPKIPGIHDEKSSQPDLSASRLEDKTGGQSGGDMLRRVGECRKKVMGMYRLLGNKADVIKGFAKRCNEHWEVAPRSEIGLYLGDIQDHIVTMTGNLSHYENLLSRAHSNYLAQINIRMNERAEQTADVLGKLTVLGTIVLPMNIITGMWGMNVWVPGQDAEHDLTWFWCITAGLLAFGLSCYFIAKKVYGIV
nr:putative metal ion transporter c17a12.14 [Quercus suber]